MTPHLPKAWRWCREPGCQTRIIFARRNGKPVPYEATDVPPFTEQSADCHVLVSGQAWRPADLIEDFHTRLEIAEPAARELVSGYPFHRPHFHDKDSR